MTDHYTARALHAEWKNRLLACAQSDDVRAERLEQDAYDTLVEFVEQNGLNYTEFDPRHDWKKEV